MASYNIRRIILNLFYIILFIAAAVGIYYILFQQISSPTPTFPSVAMALDPAPAPLQLAGNTPQFSENFDTDFGSWGTAAAGQAEIDRGGLILDDNQYNDTAWARPYLVFDNFILEVYARWIGGAVGGQYGVEFRIDEDDNYYGFYLHNGGRYTVGKQLDGNWFEIASGFSDDINNNGGLNRIHIEAVGNSFRFFVNGVYLLDVEAGSIDNLEQGDIRLIAQKADNTDTYLAAFDELVIVRYPN